MTCSVEGLERPPAGSGASRSIDEDIADLEARHVPPETFRREHPDRFVHLQNQCRTESVNGFQGYQEWLVERLDAMPPREIARRIRALYDQAYSYNPISREMPIANPQAKARLDLWNALIDARAFRDEAFLQSVLQERDIRVVMALNSPHLAPRERGLFHRFETGQMTFASLGAEEASHDRQWLLSYEGRASFFTDPYQRSVRDLHEAYKAFLGEEAYHRSLRENVPRAEIEALLREPVLRESAERVRQLPDTRIIDRLLDIEGFMESPSISPGAMMKLAREAYVLAGLLALRGRDHRTLIREENVQNLVARLGLERADAEIWVDQQNPGATASRLDDYRSRHFFLRQFEDLYRQTRVVPLNGVLCRRLNAWGGALMNRELTGIPFFLEDIDAVRRRVDATTPLHTYGPISWSALMSRDPRRTLVFRPRELGLGSDVRSDPLVAARTTRIGAISLLDMAEASTSQVVLTSDQDVIAYNHGLALSLFGIVVLSGDTFRAAPGHAVSPSDFLEVYAHEVGHQAYARLVFDAAPERLLWQGVNERFAYAVGLAAAEAYGSGLPARTRTARAPFQAFTEAIIHIANRRLGLPEDDRSRDALDPRLSGRDLRRYQFHPGMWIDVDRSERPSRESLLGTVSLPQEEERFRGFVLDFGMGRVRDLAERVRLRQAVEALDRLDPEGISETFFEGHPFLEMVNAIRGFSNPPQQPLSHATFTLESWKELKDDAVFFLLSEERQRGMRDGGRSRWGEFLRAEIGPLSPVARRGIDQDIGHLLRLRPDQSITLPATHPLIRMSNRLCRRAGLVPAPQIVFQGANAFPQFLTNMMRIRAAFPTASQ